MSDRPSDVSGRPGFPGGWKNWIESTLILLGAITIFAMMFLSVTDAFMRSLLNAPILAPMTTPRSSYLLRYQSACLYVFLPDASSRLIRWLSGCLNLFNVPLDGLSAWLALQCCSILRGAHS